MAYKDLAEKYGGFDQPVSRVEINGRNISENKFGFGISDLEVEVTAGFEASIATFWIYNSYSKENSQFSFEDLKKYIALGSVVKIYTGYANRIMDVFTGFIARVNFALRKDEMSGVEITCMDVKGIMMANNYARGLKAADYGSAVKEIFQQTAYEKLKDNKIISSFSVDDTPDKKQGGNNEPTAVSMELVAESDYDFVVKAAKKFNFEFFTQGDIVYFRKAKGGADGSTPDLELEASALFRSFSISYDITGLVGSVEVRSTDVGKAQLVSSTAKISNKISTKSRAKALVSPAKKVYIDPTVSSKEEAAARAEYLSEDIAYRFGSLDLEIVGLPDVTPGTFLKITNFGTTVSNTFYVTSVTHRFDTEDGYVTRVLGKAAKLQ